MTIDTGNRLLPGIEHRPTELGRIRLGDKSPKGLPTKTETWRLTSANRTLLDTAAGLYGGTVETWDDAPSEGYFELLTDSNTLSILIPRDLRTLSQWYEWWQGGVCERRCDGTTEQNTQLPCLCKSEGVMECRPRTRLNIMLPDVPGLGVWRLETDGWNAATSLPATIEMLLSLSTQPWVRAVLRLEQRSAKKRQPDGKVVTHRFAVPVLDTPGDLTLGRIVGQRLRDDQPRLPEPEQPQTARDRIAAQRERLEATTSGSAHGQDAPTGQAEEVGTWTPADEPRPASPAGAHAATPESDPGSADMGEPTPAPDSGVAQGSVSLTRQPPQAEQARDSSAPTPPDGHPSSAPSGGDQPKPTDRCTAFSEDHGGRCSRAPGHRGNHVASEGSWKEATA